jgi:hypothetical protein
MARNNNKYRKEQKETLDVSRLKSTGTPLSKGTAFRSSSYATQRFSVDAGKYLPKATRNRKSEIIATFTNPYYVTQNMCSISEVADVKAALRAAFELAYDMSTGASQGRDEVGAQLTAFEEILYDWVMLLFELGFQSVNRHLFARPYELDANTAVNDANGPACATIDSFDDFVNYIEQLNLMVPQVAVDLFKKLFFIIKLQDSYLYDATRIPERYYVWYCPQNDHTENEVYLGLIQANSALAISHAQKFGIKMTKFTASMVLDGYDVLDAHHPKSRFIFSLPIGFYDNGNKVKFPHRVRGADTSYLVYADGVDAGADADFWSYVKIYFSKDADPNESGLEHLRMLFYPYNATYNPYGGLFYRFHYRATQNTMTMINQYYTGYQAWTAVYLNYAIVLQFDALWKNQANILEVTINGANVADADISTFVSPVREPDLLYATGYSQSKWTSWFLLWLVDNTYKRGETIARSGNVTAM